MGHCFNHYISHELPNVFYNVLKILNIVGEYYTNCHSFKTANQHHKLCTYIKII